MTPTVREIQPPQPPPKGSGTHISWLKENLFSSLWNTAVTLLLGWFTVNFTLAVVDWALIDAVWQGETADACPRDRGACWAFVTARWQQIIYGQYPGAMLWRVHTAFALAIVLPFFFGLARGRLQAGIRATVLVIIPVITVLLLTGGILGLEKVPTDQWGGLMLTLVIASVAIVFSIPLGLVLALARQSRLPALRLVAVGFIEFWRGVPLIVVLFAFVSMLPLFVPEGRNIDILVRTVIAFAVFNSAYMAEVFRGGLQSVPRGQYEAAEAIGLDYWKAMGLVVLPQAIRNSVPALMNTCISIFKETTLVMLIGLSDLLGVIQLSLEDPDWLGPTHIYGSAYLFAALLFFVFTYGMSKYSVRLENRMNVEH